MKERQRENENENEVERYFVVLYSAFSFFFISSLLISF